MKAWCVGVFAVLALLSASCEELRDDRMVSDFLKAHPNASHVVPVAGEGDGDHVYIDFRYTERGGPMEFVQTWLYRRQDSGRWSVVWKDTPKRLPR